MKEFESSFPAKRAPSRRSYWRTIVFALCAAIVLTVFVCGYAVTMVAMAVLKGLADLSVFFSVFAALMMIPWLLELLSLLSTGQLIPFVMRLFQLLGSS